MPGLLLDRTVILRTIVIIVRRGIIAVHERRHLGIGDEDEVPPPLQVLHRTAVAREAPAAEAAREALGHAHAAASPPPPPPRGGGGGGLHLRTSFVAPPPPSSFYSALLLLLLLLRRPRRCEGRRGGGAAGRGGIDTVAVAVAVPVAVPVAIAVQAREAGE